MTSLPVTWLHVTSFPVRAASGYVTSSNSYAMARSTLLPRNMPWAVSIYYFDIGIWGTLWITRVFNWLKCLGGRMHLKPTVGCQISTLIFYFFLWRGSLLISYEKYIKDGKFLAHLGLQSRILHGSLTDLSAWVGFRTSSPLQGVKYQHWYLKKQLYFLLWRGSL